MYDSSTALTLTFPDFYSAPSSRIRDVHYDTRSLNIQAAEWAKSIQMVGGLFNLVTSSPLKSGKPQSKPLDFRYQVYADLKSPEIDLTLEDIEQLLVVFEKLDAGDIETRSIIFIDDLKESVLDFVNSDQVLKGLNIIFDKFDDKLIEGETELISAVLANISIADFPIKYLIGMLSVTNPWKEQLTSRNSYLAKVEERIISELGNARVEPILAGLR